MESGLGGRWWSHLDWSLPLICGAMGWANSSQGALPRFHKSVMASMSSYGQCQRNEPKGEANRHHSAQSKFRSVRLVFLQIFRLKGIGDAEDDKRDDRPN